MLSLPATWGGGEGGKWEADTACGPQDLACMSLTAPLSPSAQRSGLTGSRGSGWLRSGSSTGLRGCGSRALWHPPSPAGHPFSLLPPPSLGLGLGAPVLASCLLPNPLALPWPRPGPRAGGPACSKDALNGSRTAVLQAHQGPPLSSPPLCHTALLFIPMATPSCLSWPLPRCPSLQTGPHPPGEGLRPAAGSLVLTSPAPSTCTHQSPVPLTSSTPCRRLAHCPCLTFGPFTHAR